MLHVEAGWKCQGFSNVLQCTTKEKILEFILEVCMVHVEACWDLLVTHLIFFTDKNFYVLAVHGNLHLAAKSQVQLYVVIGCFSKISVVK